MAYSSDELYAFDQTLREAHGIIAGTDEVGRGPLAGPVVAAAVILDPQKPIDGVRDSKQLSEKKREELFLEIRKNAVALKATCIFPNEIEKLNILTASLTGMYRSVMPLNGWDYLLVDGNKPVPGIDSSRQETVVKGDSKSASIAAASIIAKVVHDRIMYAYHKRWPVYNFASNKGYPTAEHKEAILNHGLTPIHRISFCESFVGQISFL